ncbi:uncharacterized protein LOC129602600 [Paramacrobiotus metropolitanus]|uniref:uncharacterized protein LOC129602600 n=1 Tax=Paramacrobiotus metropolitanus TaxID=2943436 RepID=UPI00244617C3|nr:uncharacterized protein LOC129602600 [Paramacrobiotus metropolitanus]XP_055357642.1 uncharacterized protein LOC129602600 [Paramacrobiotus metropolitanus]XP_055357643.1 uncharacterized protein LOC129602600 [Paramacrobiotus metropolitanus]
MPKAAQSTSHPTFRRAGGFKVKDRRRRRQLTLLPPVLTTSRRLSTSPNQAADKADKSRLSQEEPRKKITNCARAPGVVRRRRRRRGRPPRPPQPDESRAKKSESDSEDDIPSSFSDVIKLITQKVLETQKNIKDMEDSFDNYRSTNEEPTILLMKFYASVPKLHEKVAAGAAFDDDLLEGVFEELFPANGIVAEKGKSSRFLDLLTRDSKTSPVTKNKASGAAARKKRKPPPTDDAKPVKKRRRRRKASD